MLQNVSHKFRSGCMMLTRGEGNTVDFLGTAFLVHPAGYLLTAAHLLGKERGLAVIACGADNDFAPMSYERVAAMPVSVAQRDAEHDVALLRIDQEIAIEVPDDFLGATAAVRPGASIMSLGYSFGYAGVHVLLGYGASVSAMIRARNDSRLLLYDSIFHEGDRGGPLIHVADGHIIGVVSGRFEPAEISPDRVHSSAPQPQQPGVCYAAAIEYGLQLMDAEGLD
ncbi:MAG: serine protease [Gammaproteobacteria bacterium]|jgi:serine protease Do